MGATERLGAVAGELLAPAMAALAHLRHGRPILERGAVRFGRVVPVDGEGPDAELARRLEGHAIVRFSRAFGNLLGAAVRFTRRERFDVEPTAGDQDLLFATIERPHRPRIFHAVERFDVDGLGPRKLRLVEMRPLDGRPTFRLEARELHAGARWLGVCDLELDEKVERDSNQLRFWPFRAGRGLRPAGALEALRRPVYAATQDADGAAPHRSA